MKNKHAALQNVEISFSWGMTGNCVKRISAGQAAEGSCTGRWGRGLVNTVEINTDHPTCLQISGSLITSPVSDPLPCVILYFINGQLTFSGYNTMALGCTVPLIMVKFILLSGCIFTRWLWMGLLKPASHISLVWAMSLLGLPLSLPSTWWHASRV